MGLFDSPNMRGLRLLEMGLHASVVRRDVIANNIANVDVPNFKRSEVAFEANLKRALESERAVAEEPALQIFMPGHVARRSAVDYRSVEPGVHTDYLSTMRADGNNVDMEDEITKMTRNQMQYNLYVDRIGSQFRNWNSFIRLA